MKLSLTILSLITLTACGMGDSSPAVSQQDVAIVAAPNIPTAEQLANASGPELTSAYLQSVCKFYTEPTCIDSQKQTCAAHLAFPTRAACDTFMKQNADSCVGINDLFAANKAKVIKCIDSVQKMQCDTTATCVDGKRFETRDACEPVAALIASCDPGYDTGL